MPVPAGQAVINDPQQRERSESLLRQLVQIIFVHVGVRSRDWSKFVQE